MSLKLTDTMIKAAMFLGDYGEAALSRELFAEIERLLADEWKDVLMEILALNSQLGCTPQEGYKDLTDALRDTKHLVASIRRDEREKVREMCVKALCQFCAAGDTPDDIGRHVMLKEDGRLAGEFHCPVLPIRQLDLTKDPAASSREEKV